MHASGRKSEIPAAEDGKRMFQHLKMDGWRTNIAKFGIVEEHCQDGCLRILLLEWKRPHNWMEGKFIIRNRQRRLALRAINYVDGNIGLIKSEGNKTFMHGQYLQSTQYLILSRISLSCLLFSA
uniref:Uncharacterized protein n=1 Tax=Salix viminalis TaxID=40686 RepID=A0A6N2LSC2_SALVM